LWWHSWHGWTSSPTSWSTREVTNSYLFPCFGLFPRLSYWLAMTFNSLTCMFFPFLQRTNYQ
jgi:hypothetical protein